VVTVICKCAEWSVTGEVEAQEEGKVLSGLEGLLEIMDLEVMAEGVRIGTHSEGWREIIFSISLMANLNLSFLLFCSA